MKSWQKLVCVTAISVSAIAGPLLSAPMANAASPEPGSSPGVQRIWVGNHVSAGQCSSGYLCAYVASNAYNSWWEFKFLSCGVYNLSYWRSGLWASGFDGESFVIDDQTGGVTTTYYGGYNGSGRILQKMTPWAGHVQYILPRGDGSIVGWDPVNSIRVC